MTTLFSGEAELTAWLPKVRAAGGAGEATVSTPRLEPFRAMILIAAGVSSAIVSVAAEAAPGCGVKVTSMVHRPPTSTVAGAAGQLFWTANAEASAPLTATEPTAMGALPVFA